MAFILSILVVPQACIRLAAQERRILGDVNEIRRSVVPGNVSPKARSEYDQGPVDPSLQLTITIALKRSKAQQMELDGLLQQQQDPGSPAFRKWLTPEAYADRFGMNQSDIEKIIEWLRSNGFTAVRVARGRDFVFFTGSAAQVEAALRTPIHRYRVRGELHYSNVLEPSLPDALAEVTNGFLGLDDFQRSASKRRFRPLGPILGGGKPNYTDPQSGGSGLTPFDVATIYDIQPLYQNGFTGNGQKIVVAGQTNVDLGDIRAFRQALGLPLNDPQLILVPGHQDPGIQSDQLLEADMDIEWSGAIAPNATILFVYSESSLVSALSAIDSSLAPVITYSFTNGCEAEAPKSLPSIVQSGAQKANVEGITWIVSSGDSGAAACEAQGVPWTLATTGPAVNIPASLAEVTGVGGTEFTEGAGSYWATNSNSWESALGYIPEAGWNDSTVAGGLLSSGGGISSIFTKPPWQSGVGVPNDGMRDVPDVALSASPGHDPYLIETAGYLGWYGAGTSVAAPSFAGIVTLLNQYWNAGGLGNINANLYALAQALPVAFHDVTSGSNIVPCQFGSPGCASGSFGYTAGPGYDQVTGLGSVDAAQLISNWTALPSLAVTVLKSDTTVLAGGKMNISLSVTNNGGAPAGAFRVGIFLSTSATTLANSVQFAYCDFTGLAVNATTSCSGATTVPASIQTGGYFVVAYADVLNQIVEFNQVHGARVSDSGTVTITAPCSYSLSSSGGQFTASGGAGSFSVQTSVGCSWNVTLSPPWISISGATSGVGPGTVSFVVAANGGATRSGAITVATQQFNVLQSAEANLALQFTNYLAYPATVTVNGAVAGTLTASGVASFAVPASQTLAVSFSLVRPTVGGVSIGDPMVGYWSTINNPAGTYTFSITNQIGNQLYFAPFVTNSTGSPVLMDVNLGLASENRCNCVVPAGATNVGIGYYQFYSDSTVEGFAGSSNYTGQYLYFSNLGSYVQSQTGVLRLTVNQNP